MDVRKKSDKGLDRLDRVLGAGENLPAIFTQGKYREGYLLEYLKC